MRDYSHWSGMVYDIHDTHLCDARTVLGYEDEIMNYSYDFGRKTKENVWGMCGEYFQEINFCPFCGEKLTNGKG